MSFDKQLGTSTGALGAPQLSVRACVCVCVRPERTTPGCSPFLQRTPSESASGNKQSFKQNQYAQSPAAAWLRRKRQRCQKAECELWKKRSDGRDPRRAGVGRAE